jgi:hypothetical protein
MVIVLLHLETDDYDAWKHGFDEDPVGRREAGVTSHTVSRSLDNPNDVFIRVEFPSVEQARHFQDKLRDSGVLQRTGTRVKTGPTVAEVVETISY